MVVAPDYITPNRGVKRRCLDSHQVLYRIMTLWLGVDALDTHSIFSDSPGIRIPDHTKSLQAGAAALVKLSLATH
jgi:hypothetical protein